MNIIRKSITTILPNSCSVCGRLGKKCEDLSFNLPEGVSLCFECLGKLVPVDKDRRWFLTLSEPYATDPYPNLPLYMPFPYDDFFAKVIPTIKFKKNKNLAKFLGIILGNIMLGDNIQVDEIIPIPLSEERLKERGFNQASVIGKACSEVLQVAFTNNGLVRTKNTIRQTHLKENSQRSINVQGAFRVVNPALINGRKILLIDDVATTGHTLHEAAAMLLDYGADKVLCTAVCGNRGVKNVDPY